METLRFIQERADAAYNQSHAQLKAGNLKPILSEREALGSFVDRDVRQSLRQRYNQLGINPYCNPKPYIPASLSEIYDMLGSMILWAPTFIDPLGHFPERNVDSQFQTLFEAFDIVRKKVGEERYAALIDLADRAKALFAADQDDTNGKTDQGRALLFEIEDLLRAVRRSRVKAKLPDDEGEVTGD